MLKPRAPWYGPDIAMGFSDSQPPPKLPLTPSGGNALLALSQASVPRATCLRLFWHCTRRAASRAACTAGKSSEVRMPMIAMTTRSSTRVNAHATGSA